MIRIPYPILALQIETLYQKEIPENDAAIQSHCEYIAEFIRAAGWSEEEYIERWMKEIDSDVN